MRRACCIDVSTGGELAVALAAGVPGERLVLHGNNKSEAELEAALAAGVGRIVVDSFDEIDRLARVLSRPDPIEERWASAQRPGPGDPGHRGAHPRVRDDGPGRLQVRFRPRLGRRGRGDRAAQAPDELASAWSVCTRTSARRSSLWRASSRHWRCSGRFSPTRAWKNSASAGASGVPT